MKEKIIFIITITLGFLLFSNGNTFSIDVSSIEDEKTQVSKNAYETALECYKNKKYIKAIEGFEKVIETSPDIRLINKAKHYKAKSQDAVIKEEKRMYSEKAKEVYAKGLSFYKDGKYFLAIVEFEKIKELYPQSRFVSKAESYIEESRRARDKKEVKEIEEKFSGKCREDGIDKAQDLIKRKEEAMLLARMQAVKKAQSEEKKKEESKQIAMEKKEKQREKLKINFEKRRGSKEKKGRDKEIDTLLRKVRAYVKQQKFWEAEEIVNDAITKFPNEKRLKAILCFIQERRLVREKDNVRLEERALVMAREITEEKMLLDVAKRHIIPDQKIDILKKKKDIIPLVKIPEIRKRMEIPISVEFKDLGLDYVLNFLSDITSVNIICSSQINMEEKRVTMKIKEMPLEEALRYILKSQRLIYRVEEDAVWVITEDELQKERIETKVYHLNQGIGRLTTFTGGALGEEGKDSSTEVKTIKDIIENAVDWPKDSRLTLDDRTGALIISNIPSNLGTIEKVLYDLDVTPVQVLIEARFLEVQVSDLNELGLEWKLNSVWAHSRNKEKQNKFGIASDSGVDFSDFTGAPNEGFNLTYQGILSHPQFQLVMHALKQKENVKTLSAPRITTLNNQIATIEVIDEYIYPTRYEVSLVQYDINGDGDFDDAGETEWVNIPQDFITRDIGILLHVKPSVGVDNKTITLALTPEVSEASALPYTYSGSVSIPKFQTRNLSTSVIVQSEETIVMGGLIKETNTKIETKVPFLGDLPLIGRLFKKNSDSVLRKNLLIFVTATVLDKKGDVIASNPIVEKGDKY